MTTAPTGPDNSLILGHLTIKPFAPLATGPRQGMACRAVLSEHFRLCQRLAIPRIAGAKNGLRPQYLYLGYQTAHTRLGLGYATNGRVFFLFHGCTFLWGFQWLDANISPWRLAQSNHANAGSKFISNGPSNSSAGKI